MSGERMHRYVITTRSGGSVSQRGGDAVEAVLAYVAEFGDGVQRRIALRRDLRERPPRADEVLPGLPVSVTHMAQCACQAVAARGEDLYP